MDGFRWMPKETLVATIPGSILKFRFEWTAIADSQGENHGN
jgi:hypothetical protein